MKKAIYCLFLIQSMSITSGCSQKSTREKFFDFVLSDTSQEDKTLLLIKLNLIDQNKNKIACVTYSENLYADVKRKYDYDFPRYLFLMKKILRGDTLVPYTLFSESLVNGIVYPNNEFDSVFKKGPYTFLKKYTCNDMIMHRDHFTVIFYLFDINITNDYSSGGAGHLVYFNPAIKKENSRRQKKRIKKYAI